MRAQAARWGADLFTELRAFYSQEYRLHMLRCALRDSMHRNDMGLNAYWNAIDADGSGALDRQELANAITEAGVETSSMEIDALMEAIDEDKSGLVTQEVFYHWLLSTRHWCVAGAGAGVGCGVGMGVCAAEGHDPPA